MIILNSEFRMFFPPGGKITGNQPGPVSPLRGWNFFDSGGYVVQAWNPSDRKNSGRMGRAINSHQMAVFAIRWVKFQTMPQPRRG